jgi:hypothetical protein
VLGVSFVISALLEISGLRAGGAGVGCAEIDWTTAAAKVATMKILFGFTLSILSSGDGCGSGKRRNAPPNFG